MSLSNGFTNQAFDASTENQIRSKPIPLDSKNVDSKNVESGSNQKERPNWSSSMEFLMSCIAMSVGLGNIWRFPFTAYENGGGAFVIPYLIVLFLIGKPMYYIEMIVGQFTSQSSVKIWKSVPLLKGVGIGQMIATVCVITYYCSLLAMTLYYMVVSFQSELPWSTCDKSSITDQVCVDAKPQENTTILGEGKAISSAEVYFLRTLLGEKDDISDGIGLPNWKLTIALFVAWSIIFLVIVRGVKSSGKVSYFLAVFPYVVLVTLLIRAVTLEGSIDGIIFFLKPNWEQLLNPKVWYSACTQLFFSLSVGMGTIIMFSSYNQFDHNIYRDAVIVTSLDTVTSLLAGVTIFGILGNLAHNLKAESISDVVKSGTGLAFISYPDAISKFEYAPQVFAVLFFFMLFVLGIGSIVALQSAVVSVICDQFTHLKYWKVALVTSVIGFFSGLIYVTPGGQWMLNLIDYFGGTFIVFALSIIEMLGIFWIYGLENICDDIEFMTKRRVTIYWRFCWAVVTPLLMAVIFIYSMANLKPIQYSGKDYPSSAYVAGWILMILGFLQFPIWGFWVYWRSSKDHGFVKAIKEVLSPSDQWGPKDDNIRLEWKKFKAEAQETRNNIAIARGHNWFRRKIAVIFGSY